MDLLGGYGSDASDAEEETPAPAPKELRVASSAPPGSMLPPPPRPASGGASSSRGAPSSADPALTSNPASLWSRLPRPAATSSSSAASAMGFGLLSAPPAAPSGATAAAGVAGGRKVVSLQLPYRKELLAAAALDSDEEDEPAAKRNRQGPGAGAKSRLLDFLPPPKHDVASAPALGAGPPRSKGPAPQAAAAPAGAGGAATKGAGTAAAAPLPAGLFVGGTAAFSNEAFRIRDDGADASAGGGGGYPPGPSRGGAPGYGAPHGPYGGREGLHDGQQPPLPHHYAPGPGPSSTAAAAGPATGPPPGPYRVGGARLPPGGAAAAAHGGAASDVELLEEALRAEAERAAKQRGKGKGGGAGMGAGAALKLVEISAQELSHMDPAAREAANAARDALGPEYALSLRRSAASFEGSKLAKRKHQIGTLLFNARMQELEQMEKRTAGQKSKAETAAKYGW